MDLYSRLNEVKKNNEKSMTEFNDMSHKVINAVIKAIKSGIDEKRIQEVLNGSWFDLKDDLDILNNELNSIPKRDPPFSKHWVFL